MTQTQTQVNEPLTYAQGNRHSYFRDLALARINEASDDALERLRRHSIDVSTADEFTEFTDTRSDADRRHVPPLYLLQQIKNLTSNARAYANLVSMSSLPSSVESINIPKFIGGLPETKEVDLGDRYINAPVRTITGQQGIAAALLTASPVMFDVIVWRDLVCDHAVNLDRQVISGSGTDGEMLGARHNAHIAFLPAPGASQDAVYGVIRQAAQLIYDTRYLPPTAVVMHQRRLLEICPHESIITGDNGVWRTSNTSAVIVISLRNPAGELVPFKLPVTTDDNMIDAGDTEFVHVLRASDLTLWESGLRVRVVPDLNRKDPKMVLQVYNQAAFTAARYQSVVELI